MDDRKISADIAVSTAIFIALLCVFGAYVYFEKQIDRANETRQRSFQLADQLRQSSDDLTRMARTYVETGELRFKQYYQDILDIRNGRKPEPPGYQFIYWDLVAAGVQLPSQEPARQPVPLLEQMRRAGFSEQEMQMVAASKENSDRLASLEMRAMRLAETPGLAAGNKTRALQMMFDSNYRQAKAAIMEPINEFYRLMDKRTLEQVENMVNIAMLMRFLFVALVALSVLMLWRAYRGLRRTLGASASEVHAQMSRIGRGDLSAAILVAGDAQESVLGGLGKMQEKLRAYDRERKQNEIRIANSLALTQSILETAVDPIITIDAAGIVHSFNPAAERLFAYSAREVIGMNVNVLMPEPYRSGHDGYLARYLREGVPRVIGKGREVEGRRKDGSVFPMHLSVGQMKVSQADMFVGVVVDLTERKEAEQKLKSMNEELEQRVAQRTEQLLFAKEEAEKSNMAKSQFLTSMSHELRTPLNAILGFGQLLEMHDELGAQEQQNSVKEIIRAGYQLLGLINDVLDLSAIEHGKFRLDSMPLCVAQITADCVAQVSVAMAERKQVAIENSIVDETQFVQGDELRLRQVLINYLSNAVKYNRDAGRVMLSSQLLENGLLRIKVQDTGSGIAQDKLHLLFNSFERIDQKHGTISGLGIGLHISRQLVEAMHGSVGVESAEGQGSTFWFDLPVAEPRSSAAGLPDSPMLAVGRGGSKLRVLYIDDNPVNIKLVRHAMQQRPDVEISAAATAEEGLTLVEKEKPDLILMDIQLPGIDGVAATAILKKNESTRNIPVVALSADAMHKDIKRALSAGCSEYLTKPIDLKKLYELMDRMHAIKNGA